MSRILLVVDDEDRHGEINFFVNVRHRRLIKNLQGLWDN